jgi:hypothetical protein
MSTDSQTSTPTDLEAFYSFVGQSLKQGQKDAVPEAVLQKWREDQEFEAHCEDLRQRMADMDAGIGIPAEEVFEALRRKHGIVDR